MSEYTGSARRKLDRVIGVQGYDAEGFSGGRIVRLVIPSRTATGFTFTHAFAVNTREHTRAELIARTEVPDSVVVYDEPFAAPPQEGPAKLAEREIVVADEKEAARIIKDSVSPKLVVAERLPSPARFPGPFSVRLQLGKAGLAPHIPATFYGVRVMSLEGMLVTEEVYGVLATSKAEAASAVYESFADRRDVGHIRSIEVDDTLFDRPHDANCPFIARRHSKAPMDEHLERLRLTVLPI